jgi:uncharacterized membrane protein
MSQWTAVFLVVLVGILHSRTPLLRKGLFFGVTVSPDFPASVAARQIRRSYWLSVASATFLGIALAMIYPTERHHPRGLLLAVFVQAVISSLGYVRANRCASAYSAEPPRERTIDLAQQPIPRPKTWTVAVPGCIATLGALTALSIPVNGAIPLLSGWAALQARWSFLLGQGIASQAGMALGVVTAGTVMMIALRSAARRKSALSQLTARTMMILAVAGGGAFAAYLNSAALGFHLIGSRVGANALLLLLLLIAASHLMYALRVYAAGAPASLETRNDAAWHWGMFYRDANDPALLVEKRSGPGYTLNFGHPLSWPLAFVFVGVLCFVFVRLLHA